MDETTASPAGPDLTTRILRWILGVTLVLVVGVALWYAYAYAITPAALRRPVGTHYHFRMQIIVDGAPVDFADPKYQTILGQDICTAALTKEPVHFHDKIGAIPPAVYPGDNLFHDSIWIFGAWIIARYDHHVGQISSDFAHHGPFRSVPNTTASKYTNKTFRVQGAG